MFKVGACPMPVLAHADVEAARCNVVVWLLLGIYPPA